MTGNARSFQEKRDYIRMQMDTPAVITANDKQHPGRCLDLSSSGIQFKSSQAIEVNSQIRLDIQDGIGNVDGLTVIATILRVNLLEDDTYRYGACIDSYL